MVHTYASDISWSHFSRRGGEFLLSPTLSQLTPCLVAHVGWVSLVGLFFWVWNKGTTLLIIVVHSALKLPCFTLPSLKMTNYLDI